ncbi:MAG: hypothetical protein IIA14_09390 [SAR324 cluster bacterium]|nr:hypothetical protein [SAR324 cluster bacterium]
MDELLSLIQPEPWSRFTAALIASMAFSRGMDFLSTWIVTPKLELEANPLMRRAGFIRMALTILTKSFQEQGATPLMVTAAGGAR